MRLISKMLTMNSEALPPIIIVREVSQEIKWFDHATGDFSHCALHDVTAKLSHHMCRKTIFIEGPEVREEPHTWTKVDLGVQVHLADLSCEGNICVLCIQF